MTIRAQCVIPRDTSDAVRCDGVRHDESSAVLTSMTSVAFDVDDVVSWRWSTSETRDVRLSCYKQCRI